MANTLKDELTNIIENEQPIADNKVANFGYEDTALADPQTYADGVTDYDFERPNNIPIATAETLKVNETILTKGFRSQASSVTRMLVNHFFGRVSYNLNKTVELVQRFFTQFKAYMGAPNGIATLDANGRVPASQLPETALEYQGNWNASTNEITNHTLGYDSLINGTGTKGDLFLCEVEGWFNASTGECSATKPEPSTGYVQYFVNDRVIYDGASWNRLSSGDIKKVNGLSPVDGNVQLTHKLTLAQYNALTSLERQGKLFVITDIEGVDMFIINDYAVGTDTVWSSSKTKAEFDSINNKIPSTATTSNKLVDTAQLNGALTNYLPKISIAIGDGAHNSVPISTIGDGTYVVMLSALYSNWNIFYIGVLCIYGNDIRLDTVSHNGFSVTADRSNIYTNVTLSSARLIPFGYWG